MLWTVFLFLVCEFWLNYWNNKHEFKVLSTSNINQIDFIFWYRCKHRFVCIFRNWNNYFHAAENALKQLNYWNSRIVLLKFNVRVCLCVCGLLRSIKIIRNSSTYVITSTSSSSFNMRWQWKIWNASPIHINHWML